MGYNFVTNLEPCYFNIPALIYYSHIPTALVGIALGIFVFLQAKRTPTSFFLFLFSSLFTIWSAVDLVLWLSPNSSLIIYFWSIINLLEILTSLSVFYFIYLFFEEKYPPFYFNLFVFFELTIYTLLIPTNLNLGHFDYTICEALQGPLTNLFYLIEGLTLFIIVVYLIKKIFTKKDSPGAHTTIFAVGALLFVLSFTGANLAASALAFLYPESPDNWKILQYGLMSMPIFMAFLTYTIVKFKIFNSFCHINYR